MSATSSRNASKTFESKFDSPDRTHLRDVPNFSFRKVDGDLERSREPRNSTLRPRRADGGDKDDSDGWSTVKPRKSFGTEGAERFNGRMGGESRGERRGPLKDRNGEERELKERITTRGFDAFTRDKDIDHELEVGRKNGFAHETGRGGRGRNEPSWFKDRDDLPPPKDKDRISNGEKFSDRNRGWREKDGDDRGGDKVGEGRGERRERGDRGDRRWDRDRENRQEREPEWMYEPSEDKTAAHTVDDFQKWKESMQNKDKPANKPPVADAPKTKELASFFGGSEDKSSKIALEPQESGPDKFFGLWSNSKEGTTPGLEAPEGNSGHTPAAGKSSRFTSFFSAPESESLARGHELPANQSAPPSNAFNPPFTSNAQHGGGDETEKAAFANLLQKLKVGSGATPPASASFQLAPPPPQERQELRQSSVPAPDNYHQYRSERQEEPRAAVRISQQQGLQDLLHQRQNAGSQPGMRSEQEQRIRQEQAIRQEQMLQELVGQRHNSYNQTPVRPDQPLPRPSNTEFLMGLMQSAKAAPEPMRTEQMLMRMPQLQNKPSDRSMQQQMMEREQQEQLHREAVLRERAAVQRRPAAPPGFYDEPSFQQQRGPPPQHEGPRNPPQPTQILQRPPPPGLDQLQQGWAPQPSQHQSNQQLRHLAPPPGLAGSVQPRGIPVQPSPQQMYPPGFPPMGNFPPPPEVLVGQPRGMQPPPGFFNAPPPGFLPPGMNGFQGPEGMVYGGPVFDGRGMPPGFRRQ